MAAPPPPSCWSNSTPQWLIFLDGGMRNTEIRSTVPHFAGNTAAGRELPRCGIRTVLFTGFHCKSNDFLTLKTTMESYLVRQKQQLVSMVLYNLVEYAFLFFCGLERKWVSNLTYWAFINNGSLNCIRQLSRS